MSEETKNNSYGFDFSELTSDQMLQYYVAAKLPVFLHGPSGVGKSTRVKQIDPNREPLILKNQMELGEILGDIDPKTGERKEPRWHKNLVEKCTKEPNKTHILFIDELTNVKPSVQSNIFNVVWDSDKKDAPWPLPENCTVVAAGNESADNLAAYPLTNALFRRFSHIYFEVDVSNWLKWAFDVNSHTELPEVKLSDVKSKIHPAIISFIKTHKERVLNQDLDEDNPKIVPDPRKWEMASKILYMSNNPNILRPAVGDEITDLFIEFVKSAKLTAQDVVNRRYTQSDIDEIRKNTATKYATTAALSNATEKELPYVRNFVKSYLDKEQLQLFDMLWISGDKQRVLTIGAIRQQQNELKQTKQPEKTL